MRAAAVALSASLLCLACAGEQGAGRPADAPAAGVDLAAMRQFIQARNDRFARAHVTGSRDSAVTVDYFTDDARVFPPNAPAASGRAAIEVLTAEYMRYDIRDFRERTTMLYGGAGYLVEEGTYEMAFGPDSTIERGKYTNVWKQVDGDWKVYSNIWNTDAPPAP